MSELAYSSSQPMGAGMPDRMPATAEMEQHIARLNNITDELAKRLDPVLRSPHPTPDQNVRAEPSSPLRNIAAQLDAANDRLMYVLDRIDL